MYVRVNAKRNYECNILDYRSMVLFVIVQMHLDRRQHNNLDGRTNKLNFNEMKWLEMEPNGDANKKNRIKIVQLPDSMVRKWCALMGGMAIAGIVM